MRFKPPGVLSIIVIAALIIYAAVSLVGLNSEISDAEASRLEAKEQADEMVRRNAELQYEIDHSTDPEIIEGIARDKLGLVLPGEKIFYDLNN